MYQRYRDKVTFLAVYVREAHPTDGWRERGNDKVGISFAQPRSSEERRKVAQKCCATLEITMPLVVDTLDDRVGHAYSGMPDRLYVIDRAGKVAYQGGRGPFGFKSGEMEQSLIMLLLEEATVARTKVVVKPPVKKTPGRLPVLSNEEAWKRLPAVAPAKKTKKAPATKPASKSQSVLPLPPWARMLAGTLPQTTARMLEIDALHRSGKYLDARLAAIARWSVADALGCAYSKSVAVADLQRAGGTPADIKLLTDPEQLPTVERLTAALARRMMREAYAVTDAEAKQLIGLLGEERFVALVALLAHADFQDRLFLSLGVQAEPVLPPLAVLFVRPESKSGDHKSPPAKVARPAPGTTAPGDSEAWLGLQGNLDKQRARTGRIHVPSREEVLRRIGEKHPGAWQTDILWSRVCYGYQPELTDGFFGCVAAFRQETALEPVFSQSVFWIATRALRCFY
jgi:hypothetical protein